MATIEDFNKLDIRVGKIVEVEDYPGARKPSYTMKIDFGPEIGVKKSIGNFPPFQMGPAVSEVLTLGFPDEEGKAILVVPDRDVPLGGKLF